MQSHTARSKLLLEIRKLEWFGVHVFDGLELHADERQIAPALHEKYGVSKALKHYHNEKIKIKSIYNNCSSRRKVSGMMISIVTLNKENLPGVTFVVLSEILFFLLLMIQKRHSQ